VDCVGNWSEWDNCSRTCGGGLERRTYNVTVPVAFGGNESTCAVRDGVVQRQPCNEQSCPVDCVGDWLDWGNCSATCDAGPVEEGCSLTLGSSEEEGIATTTCELTAADADADVPVVGSCAVATGSGTCDYVAPAASRGGGNRTRGYEIITPAQFGGNESTCEQVDAVQNASCNEHLCNATVNCSGEWGRWAQYHHPGHNITTQCSAACGAGTRSRVFSIVQDAANNGTCNLTSGVVQEENCTAAPCAIDCAGGWDAWGVKLTQAEADLDGDGALSFTEYANMMQNKKPCSEVCGGGLQMRTYSVVTPAAFGGREDTCEADGDYEATRACSTQGCPVDCVGNWTEWDMCSRACGGGLQRREYNITTLATGESNFIRDAESNPSIFGNESTCEYFDGLLERKVCNEQNCSVDCEGDWLDWGQCSAACGGGTRTRGYAIITRAQFGGNESTCEAVDAVQTASCNEHLCNATVNCTGEWGHWTQCNVTQVYGVRLCGNGTRSHAYSIVRPAANGGLDSTCTAAHGAVVEDPCSYGPCPVDCAGSWGAWHAEDFPGSFPDSFALGHGYCSQECGSGLQHRNYSVATAMAHGGREDTCEADDGYDEQQPCNMHPCPVDCVGNWGVWHTCSRECAGGVQDRAYMVNVTAAYGGNVSTCEAQHGELHRQVRATPSLVPPYSLHTAC
jgi:hypothetical protein